MKTEIPIIIDSNPSLRYEKTWRMYHLLFLPVMMLTTLWVAIKKKIFGPKLEINAFCFERNRV